MSHKLTWKNETFSHDLTCLPYLTVFVDTVCILYTSNLNTLHLCIINYNLNTFVEIQHDVDYIMSKGIAIDVAQCPSKQEM